MLNIFSKPGTADPLASERRDLEQLLQQYPLFQGLNPKQLAGLVPALRIKQFQEEEIVCHCPGAFHDAFLLLSGVAAVTRRKGDLIYVVQLERTGAVFNIAPLVGMSPDEAGVKALGNVEILAMDNTMLSQMLQRDPRLGYAFVRNLSRLALGQCERQLDRYLQ